MVVVVVVLVGTDKEVATTKQSRTGEGLLDERK